MFADPDRFDVGRTPNPHVSFGGGVHFCIGAPLARLESHIAFARLLERTTSLELVEDVPAWRDQVNLRGLERLMVRVRWAKPPTP